MSTTRIVVLATGGTIASATRSNGGVEPGLGVSDMLTEIQGAVPGIELVGTQVTQVASSELDWADVLTIRSHIEAAFDDGATGVVVTEGTDAIEEVAFALDLLTETSRGPVVVTGAMRNPTMMSADGAANLAAAILTAAEPRSRGRGCLVVLNDEIHAAKRVRKTHTSNVATFVSPELGPVGTLTEDRVVFHSPPPAPRRIPPIVAGIPPVAIITIALGDDGRLIDRLQDAGYAGCVVQAMGGGHTSPAVADRLQQLAATMPVVLASRTGAGSVLSRTYSFVGSERDLLSRGLISAGRLDGLKSRVLLSVLLAGNVSGEGIRDVFSSLNASE